MSNQELTKKFNSLTRGPRRPAFKSSFRLNNIQLILLISMAFLTGCGEIQGNLGSLFGRSSKGTLSGKVIGVGISSLKASSASNSVMSCASGRIQIFRTTADGEKQGLALAETDLHADGSYEFPDISGFTEELNGTGSSVRPLILELSGCTTTYRRYVTGQTGQNLSAGSSLLAFLGNSVTMTAADAKKFDSVLATLEDAVDEAAAYSLITSDSSLGNRFQQAFGIAPSALLAVPPQIDEAIVPATGSEASAVALSARVNHWSPGYPLALEWHETWVEHGVSRDVLLSVANNAIWTPSANKQGVRNLRLIAGQSNGSGRVDLTKAYRTENFSIRIANTVPATAPSLQFTGTVISSVGYTGTAAISLGLATGTLGSDGTYQNCQNFSDLAILESDDSAPDTNPPSLESDWNIQCDTAGTQTIPFTLSSAGNKSLRIWARDSAGNVSASPSVLQVRFDQTSPSLTLDSFDSGGTFAGGVARQITWTALDASFGSNPISISYSTNNGTSWTSITSNTANDGSESWTLPSVNSSQVKIQIVATDLLGNTTTKESATAFTIDSLPPAAPVLSLSSAAFSNSTTVSVSLTCQSDFAKVLITASATAPTPSDSAWQTCASSLSTEVATGNGTKTVRVWSQDAAGNISSTAGTASMTLDQSAPTLAFTTVPSSAQRGGASTNIQFTVTEPNITTAQSFVIATSEDNGATWSDQGSVTSTAGPLNTASFSSSLTFPTRTVAQFRVKVTATDRAGNSGSVTSSPFVLDSNLPTISSFQLAGGASTVANPYVIFSLAAADTTTAVTNLRFSESATYANDSWQDYATSGQYQLSMVSGGKTIHVWVRDAAGNVSASPASYAIALDYGSPPVVSLVSPVPTAGQNLSGSIELRWSCSSSNGLAPLPVSLKYSPNSDGTGLQTIASNLPNNLTTSTGNHYWTLPSGVTQFRILVQCSSAAGVVTQNLSGTFNASTWSIWAGDVGLPTEGVNAYTAFLTPDSQNRFQFAVDKNNNTFIYYANYLRKVDAVTGSVSVWAGNGSGCSSMADGTILSPSTAIQILNIYGTSSSGEEIYASLCGLSAIHKINTTTGAVKKLVDLPTVPGGNQYFMTASKVLLFASNRVLYKLPLEVASPTPVAIYGNSSSTSCDDAAYAINTPTLNLPIAIMGDACASMSEGMSIYSNAAATKIFVGIWSSPLRRGYVIEELGGVYKINSAFSTTTVNQYCVPYRNHATKVLCADRWKANAYTIHDMADMSVSTIAPAGMGVAMLSFTLTPSKQNFFISANDGLWVENGSSSSHIYGVSAQDVGLGQPLPSKMNLLQPSGITYDPTNGKIYVVTQTDTKIVDVALTANISRTAFNNNNAWPIRIDKGGTRSVSLRQNTGFGIGQISPIMTGTSDAQIVNQAGTVVGPWADGTGAYPGTPKITSAGYRRLLPHSDGTTFFHDFRANNYILYKVSAAKLYKVAGLESTAPGYRAGDHGAVATTALLAGVNAIQEIPSGAFAGDLLIVDGSRLRRISYKSEATPKIYDVVNLGAAGFSDSGLTDVFYDFSSEQSSVFGSGKIYYYNGSVKRIQFDSTLTTPTAYTYPFEGTTFSGAVQVELTPHGLLVLQPAKSRILRAAP